MPARHRHASGRRDGFYPFLLLLLAGVSGAFLTGDLFNLYVWFEVMLIASFGLMVLGGDERAARRRGEIRLPQLPRDDVLPGRARLLYGVFGTLNMADIASRSPAVRRSAR